MTFWEHLEELRVSLMRCLWVFFAGFLIAYFCSDHLLEILKVPLFKFLPPEKKQLYYTSLFENFLVHLRVSAFASLTFLSPLYFWLIWNFIAPGLKPSEKKMILPYTFAAAVFFILGASFAYFFLFPVGVQYFLQYGSPTEVPWLTLESYVSTILKVLFGFGICFEFPVAVILLVKSGLVPAEKFAQNRKLVLIAITILAALVAPPDAVSMLLLMAPLYLMFEISLFIAQKVGPSKDTKY